MKKLVMRKGMNMTKKWNKFVLQSPFHTGIENYKNKYSADVFVEIE